MTLRPAQPADVAPLARIWFDGWHDAHAAILPDALCRDRTEESFRHRLAHGLHAVITEGPVGTPLGFAMVKGDELNQLYVAASARGTGLADRLMAAAEERLAADGVTVAWLACAIGNARAARFYERRGWVLAGEVINHLTTAEGPFDLLVWRYEKRLLPAQESPA